MVKVHVYVITPFRARGKQIDRKSQLDFFIPYMAGYLNGQGVDYTLVVVEQNDDKPFNTGKLKNCGFLESKKLCKAGLNNTIVFQNVDIIPRKIEYTGYSKGTTNACGWVDGCGSLCFFDIESFDAINGFPNNQEGWGGDDQAIIERCNVVGVPIRKHEFINNPEHVREIDTIPRDFSTNLTNISLIPNDMKGDRWKSNGVSNCTYTIDKMTHNTEINYYHFWVSW